MRKNEIVEASLPLLHQTEKAYCFDSGKNDMQGKPIPIWIPKSQVESYDEETFALEIPEWLAIEKSLHYVGGDNG